MAFEHLNSMPLEALRLRLKSIQHIIEHCYKIHDGQLRHVLLTIGYTDTLSHTSESQFYIGPAFQWVEAADSPHLTIDPYTIDPVLKFLHDYCTTMCAEKHMVETLIKQREIPKLPVSATKLRYNVGDRVRFSIEGKQLFSGVITEAKIKKGFKPYTIISDDGKTKFAHEDFLSLDTAANLSHLGNDGTDAQERD